MYQSSTSSSSSQGPSSSTGGGLMRYGSAPSSLLATAVDSVISATREFSSHSHQNDLSREEPTPKDNITNIGLQRSYGFGGGVGGIGGTPPSLVRHSSSPAGFLNQLAAAAGDNGFCLSRAIGGDNGISRLNSQLSFTRQQSSSTLSHISEENDDMMNVGMNGTERKSSNCYSSSGGFGIINNRSWDVNETGNTSNNTITFSMAMQPNKRAKTNMENQFEFSMGMGLGTVEGSLDMTAMEKLMHIPQDSVPCKIRAKRGCATHPRSIAERERRTRISGKLKKLQILVPNMDKQTSYSDMLDLAVQHIKSLQNQVQKLNQEVENCTCGCNTKDL